MKIVILLILTQLDVIFNWKPMSKIIKMNI